MDNLPRLPKGCHVEWSHGFMSWIDTTLQQILAARSLARMARRLDRSADAIELEAEAQRLTRFVNEQMWDERSAFYMDRFRDGSLSRVKTIGAYWALLAEAVPPARQASFLAHLENPAEFKRLHRVPALSADDPAFDPEGGYWRGGVWAPTNYMVLRGLSQLGRDELAFEIARNHLDCVTQVFGKTGTFFENYAPDQCEGKFRKDFVGWTGLSPIAVLFEYVFGLRPDMPSKTLVWDIRLTDAFGVDRYPLGKDGWADLRCARRTSPQEQPRVSIRSSVPIRVKLRWSGGETWMDVKPQGQSKR
jgi:glycogen debranching enzyme